MPGSSKNDIMLGNYKKFPKLKSMEYRTAKICHVWTLIPLPKVATYLLRLL